MSKRYVCFVLIFFVCLITLIFPNENIRFITRLNNKDDVFREFTTKVTNSFKIYAQNDKKTIDVDFYAYYCDDKLDFMGLASRCNLRHETIATLNRISNPKESLSGRKIFLPTANGLFVPNNPKTPLEQILKKKYFSEDISLCYTINEEKYYFIPDAKFDSTLRAFFLDVLMRFPLPQGIVTSDFGLRTSPISGKKHFHGGIDIAAPHGTDVLACKNGIVLQTGYDDVYGNFIVINHDEKNQSLYAHLSEILIKTNDYVSSGKLIGRVGSTGASTGPHLHFEIRNGEKKINPRVFMRN